MELQRKILGAAVRIFSEVGFRGATTRRIAQEAGVSEITLFRHFGSKGKLLQQAILAAAADAPNPALPAEPLDPHAELLAWARHQLDHMRARRAFIRTCLAELNEHPEMMPPGGGAAVATESLTRYLTRLRALGRTTAPFDPGIASQMLVGALFADAMARDAMPDLFHHDPERTLHGFIDQFLRGLGIADAAPATLEGLSA